MKTELPCKTVVLYFQKKVQHREIFIVKVFLKFLFQKLKVTNMVYTLLTK